MKKHFFLVAVSIFLILVCLSASASGSFPSRNINAVVAWGAGGGTDQVMRPLCAIAEKLINRKIVVQNMPGGTGSIAAQYVYDARPDGYTLLLHAENPALYQILDISELGFGDFDCVLLIGDETTGIVVNRDSGYETFYDLVDDAKQNPSRIKLATTGVGGLPWEMNAMLFSETNAVFSEIPYDSDASALKAVLNGECDFTVCKVQNGYDYWKNGNIRFIALFSDSPVSGMEGIPLITDYYPEFGNVLPWGPFYGVYVKKNTDPAIVSSLQDLFRSAFISDEYQALLNEYRINPYGLTGAEAEEYIERWKNNTVNALKRSGII